MKDDFDVHAWNYKRYLNENDDAQMGAEEESDRNVVGEADGEKEYKVEYWVYRNDDYDDEYITVRAKSEEEAIETAKSETGRGKNYKIYKR